MHPLLNQELAKQHMENLQHEAMLAYTAMQTNIPGEVHPRFFPLSFLWHWHNRTRLLSRRPVVPHKLEEVKLEEIKPAVLTTFSVMHEVGLISQYDDQFIEKFLETLERELVHQSHCNCV